MFYVATEVGAATHSTVRISKIEDSKLFYYSHALVS